MGYHTYLFFIHIENQKQKYFIVLIEITNNLSTVAD